MKDTTIVPRSDNRRRPEPTASRRRTSGLTASHRCESLEPRYVLAASALSALADVSVFAGPQQPVQRGLDLGAHTLSVPASAAPVEGALVRVRLATTDLNGNPITSVQAGAYFRLEAYVQDLRAENADGVRAAYVDVTYDRMLAWIEEAETLTFGPDYPNGHYGEFGELIDEAGAYAGQTPLGPSERLLWSVVIHSANPGLMSITSDPADGTGHDVLLYGMSTPVPSGQVEYTGIELTIEENLPAQVSGIESAPLQYHVQQAPLIVTSTLMLTDDGSYLQGAVVEVTGGGQFGDELGFTDQNGITGISSGGILELTGLASLADYQAALRSVTFASTELNPAIDTRWVSFSVFDGYSFSEPAIRYVEVVNDPAVVTGLEVQPLTYHWQQAPLTISTTLTVTDDGGYVAGAVVFIQGGSILGDQLGFTDQNGITGRYEYGVLSLGGWASVADYQAALRSVTFSSTEEFPQFGARLIGFVVHDGNTFGDAGYRSVEVVNDSPVLSGLETQPLQYHPQQAPVPVTSSLVLIDDGNYFAGAAVYVGGYQVGDQLGFSAVNGITGSYENGLLQFSGFATKADYQAALRSVTFSSTELQPSLDARALYFSIHDGNAESFALRNVEFVNNPPTVGGMPTLVEYHPQQAPVAVSNSLTLSDDGGYLRGAFVIIGDGYEEGDQLGFTNQNGITATISPQGLELSGWASLADYQAALRSVTFSNMALQTGLSVRRISFVVNDGYTYGNAATRFVNVVNDAPLIGGAPTVVDYHAQHAPVTIANNLTVSDDGAYLQEAFVMIDEFVQDEQLGFTAQNGITGTYGNNVLHLTGWASLADYQAALRSVTYSSSLLRLGVGERRILFFVNDGHDFSDAGTRYVNVVNDPSVVSGIEPDALIYHAQQVPLVVSRTVMVADDSSYVQGAIVQITSGLISGDQLNFTAQNGITGSFSGSTLTLSGWASLADYQAALRSVTFSNTELNPTTGGRSIAFALDDGYDYGLVDFRIVVVDPQPAGDMNRDGVLNNLDIQPFELALTKTELYASLYGEYDFASAGDINGDGAFNNIDIQPFERSLTRTNVGSAASASDVDAALSSPEIGSEQSYLSRGLYEVSQPDELLLDVRREQQTPSSSELALRELIYRAYGTQQPIEALSYPGSDRFRRAW